MMGNNLTRFEKGLLRNINFWNNKKYTYKNFMEWNTRKETIEKNLKKDEILYDVSGFYVAIKKSGKNEWIKLLFQKPTIKEVGEYVLIANDQYDSKIFNTENILSMKDFDYAIGFYFPKPYYWLNQKIKLPEVE